MNTINPSDNKIVRDFAMKNDKKEEFFHTSGYAEAQNGANIGTASTGLTMAERKAIEEKRKFVSKYNDSKMFAETLSLRHAKKYDPNTAAPATYAASHNRTDVVGDAHGNVRTSYGRTAGKPGETMGNSYVPYKTGSSSGPSKPGGITPSIRPKPISFK